MMHRSPPWLSRVVDDLRRESDQLLEVGLASAIPAGLFSQFGPLLRSVLLICDKFTHVIPELLSGLEHSESSSTGEWISSMVPKSARMPRSPRDFVATASSITPIRWLRFEPDARRDSQALRWLLHLNEHLSRELRTHEARLSRHIEEAMLVRAGETDYATVDLQTLKILSSEVEIRRVRLRKSEAAIREMAVAGLYSNDRQPSPFPRTQGWQRVKKIAAEMFNPTGSLGLLLGGLLAAPVMVADIPFLYQRWCGLQIIFGFERLGWVRHSDMIGPLFLGGQIQMTSGKSRLTLWIEPRISLATMALTGWRCSSSQFELTPDFLITCGEVGSRDGFVIDATLSKSNGVFQSKAKYLSEMTGVDTLIIAGVPVSRRLQRSWAIAPFTEKKCQLMDSEGRSGAVPLHPTDMNLEPLDAWLEDISKHARIMELVQLNVFQ